MNMWKQIWNWIDAKWIRFYYKFAFFHLMKHKSSHEFIIIFDWHQIQEMDDYYIIVSKWTPFGFRSRRRAEIFWSDLMNALGESGRMELFKRLDERGNKNRKIISVERKNNA